MAFMGIILMYLVIILVILIVCLFVCASCFIISGLIMSFKRRKAENGARVSQPWYVIVLRISGVIAAVPLVLFALVLVYSAVRTAIDRHTNLANALSRNDYVSAEDSGERRRPGSKRQVWTDAAYVYCISMLLCSG